MLNRLDKFVITVVQIASLCSGVYFTSKILKLVQAKVESSDKNEKDNKGKI